MFFKSLFVHNREILMIRDIDDEYKDTYGITQNGFLDAETIDKKLIEEKESIDKKKLQPDKDKCLANKLYSDLCKEDKNVIDCMKSEMYAFKEKRKIINLQVDNTEDDPAEPPTSDVVINDE